MLGTRFHPSGRHLTDEFRKQVARVQLVFKPSSDNEKSDDVLLRHGKIYLLVSLSQRTRNRRASWAERGTQSLRNTCNPCSCFRTNCTFRFCRCTRDPTQFPRKGLATSCPTCFHPPYFGFGFGCRPATYRGRSTWEYRVPECACVKENSVPLAVVLECIFSHGEHIKRTLSKYS